MPRSSCFWDDKANVSVGRELFVANSKMPNVVAPGKSLCWSVKDIGDTTAKGVLARLRRLASPLTELGAKNVFKDTAVSPLSKFTPKVIFRARRSEVDA